MVWWYTTAVVCSWIVAKCSMRMLALSSNPSASSSSCLARAYFSAVFKKSAFKSCDEFSRVLKFLCPGGDRHSQKNWSASSRGPNSGEVLVDKPCKDYKRKKHSFGKRHIYCVMVKQTRIWMKFQIPVQGVCQKGDHQLHWKTSWPVKVLPHFFLNSFRELLKLEIDLRGDGPLVSNGTFISSLDIRHHRQQCLPV